MEIIYSPIRDDHLQYNIKEEIVYIKHIKGVDKVNFSELPDGKMVEPITFISSAERVEGNLKITLRQPVDDKGIPINRTSNFNTDAFNEIEVIWKTVEEIEQEKNAPKPPTAEERLEAAELAIINLMMEG